MYYPHYAYTGEQSKLLALSSASFFNCSYCFDFSYPMPSAQFSLDCTTLDCNTNETRMTKKIFKRESSFKKILPHT